tara:strand:- start:1550 stop:2566 length:1017 start_codon:yes stop_codon:yes gene_type:complete
MSGGKGGSTTSEVKVPQYIEDAARANLARADELAKIGYTPYYGPDVAAFTPMQEASFQNTADMARAFGVGGGTGGGMPEPTTYANGVRGYSSAPLYEQSLAQLRRERPGQYDALTAPFIDPVTGAAPSAPYGDAPYAPYGGKAEEETMSSVSVGDYGGAADQGQSNFGGSGGVGGMLGGYTSVGDMRDGGGKAVKGGAFQGGGKVSDVANAVTGGDGPGGDKVICTALHKLGRLSDEMYALDAEFGLRVNREDPMLGDGYRLWATSVAEYIKGDSLGSKVALAIVSPVAKAWAAEMAHVMRPSEYKSNIFGKALMVVGHPTCRMIGKVFLPKVNKEIV